MKAINYMIVEVESAYNNEKKLGDVSIVVNSTIESVEHINRIARVIASPEFTPIKAGDEIIIHHNICRLRNGIKGQVTQSDYHIEDNKYFVPLMEIFAYKPVGGEWTALAPFCFVEPIKDETKKIGSIIVQNSGDVHKGMLTKQGIIKYTNPELEEYGIKEDDHIAFSEDSEYEFVIDGKTYYRMKTNDILGKFE
jgi:Co-chaperonin GroES (HSP10)